MNALTTLIINTLAVFVTAYILPGVEVQGFFVALVVAVVLAVVNTTIRPLLIVFTIPITILTLGLFIFIINAFMILLTSAIVPGFTVVSFWWALLFSLIVSLISSVLHSFAKPRSQGSQ